LIAKLLNSKGKDAAVPYLFILPFILSFFAFFLYPSIYSFVLSFYRYKGYGGATFVGFNNYSAALSYGTFWISIKNTLIYMIGHMIPVMTISFLLAVALQSKFLRGKGFYKTMIFLPQVVAVVAGALVWRIILSTQSGVINTLLHTEIPFLESVSIMKWSVVAYISWRGIGWFFVIYLAGLTTINEEINEASMIDGANFRHRMWYITLPLMKPFFLFAFLIDSINSFKIYTEPNLMLGNGGNIRVDGMPIINLITNNINGGSFGMAAAYGWLLFILTLVVAILQFALFREEKRP
jgi:ABC-type sugar transport system permease subunit